MGFFQILSRKIPPKIKKFTSFSKISKSEFQGIRVYVRNHLRGNILRVPNEDDELEVVHIIIKNRTHFCNVFCCYIDVESRSDQDKISKVCHKLKWKKKTTIERGKVVILIEDINRPLQVERPSFGTRLLEQWLEEESVTLLNDKFKERCNKM